MWDEAIRHNPTNVWDGGEANDAVPAMQAKERRGDETNTQNAICNIRHVVPVVANAGRQNIHRSYRFSVIVLTHVKCFDRRRIIRKNNRPLEMFFNEIALVFALQIHAPARDLVLKFLFLIVITLS